jgi:FF domain
VSVPTSSGASDAESLPKVQNGVACATRNEKSDFERRYVLALGKVISERFERGNSSDGSEELPWELFCDFEKALVGDDARRRELFARVALEYDELSVARANRARREARAQLAEWLADQSGKRATFRELCMRRAEVPDAVASMPDADRLLVFRRHMAALVEADRIEYERLQSEERVNVARERRDLFRRMLAERYEAGQFCSAHSWSAFFALVVGDPRFVDMLGMPGSTPRDLYNDFVDEHAEAYDKSGLDAAISAAWAAVLAARGDNIEPANFDEFYTLLCAYSPHLQFNVGFARRFFYEHDRRRRRKLQNQLYAAIEDACAAQPSLLRARHHSHLTSLPSVGQHPAFLALPDIDRLAVVIDFITDQNNVPLPLCDVMNT